MGNCQAVDTATLVIQHPSGKEEKLCWPVSASYVMKMNPGHYVALLLSTTTLSSPPPPSSAAHHDHHRKSSDGGGDGRRTPLRVTRIKLLRPTDTLVLGQVYRLITTQEVTKGLMAKKCAKMKKHQTESAEIQEMVNARRSIELEKENQTKKQEKQRPRISRSWQPSLQSISEGSS